jgi:hypothetical protein
MTTENIIWQHSRQLLITACCVLYLSATSQSLWNRTYIEDRSVLLLSSVEVVNKEFHVVGTSGEVGVLASYDRFFYGIIDSNGIMTQFKNMYDSVPKSYSAFLNALTQDSAGNLLYTGYSVDTTVKVNLIRINTATNDILLNEYYTPNTYAFYGSKVLSVGCDYFITGVRTDLTVNSAENILIKVDSNGNRIWQKQYGVSNRIEYARSLVLLQNGNLMIGSFRSDFNQANEHANTWLLEVDTAGQVVRQWFDPNDSTYVAEGLRQTQDGGFIYGAQKKNYQSGLSSVSYNATIVKMDYNFNKQWVFTRGGNDLSIYTGINDIEELADGSFVAAGNLTYYGTDTALNGYIVKLDAAGNLIWERTYRGIPTTQSLNFLTDIDLLPDGGLIAVGQCQLSGATPPQVGWFLKLDSNGCEAENCLVGIEGSRIERQEASDIQVWPNPTSSVVNILIEPDMLGAEIQLLDVTGKVLLSHKATGILTELNIAHLSKGWYVVVVKKQGRISKSKLIIE